MTLTVENLGKRFNREWIFKNFNYSFNKGIYAITGPNGSGKSTMLQVLWGQLPQSVGSVSYALRDSLIPVEEVHQHLAIATPYMELIEEFTLSEVLNFHFSFKKIRNNRSCEELLDLMELSHVRDKHISQFSSGMKQRLKLGLAFFSEVEMVFLDEPTTNLDRQSILWYSRHFDQIASNSMVFIGSNLENEYPDEVVKINLMDYK